MARIKMTSYKRESNLHSNSNRSSRGTDGLILDVNNIQGRCLRGVLTVNIKNVRTVAQLKSTIAACHNLSVMDVLYRGVRLGDDRQLAHLLPTMLKIGRSPRFSVRTRLLSTSSKRSNTLILFVKGLGGPTFQVHLAAESTVADLKKAIREAEGYCSLQDFQLTCGGKNLSKQSSSLASYNMGSGSLVHVIGRLLGGEGAPEPMQQTFVDMENMSSLRTCNTHPASPTSPTWSLIGPGLSIVGECQYIHCEAYGSTVRCSKGFTVFNIAEPVKCPSCKMPFMAITCGFNACEWMFEGRKTGALSVDVMSTWNVTPKQKFQWFDDAEGLNTAEWSSLVITAKALTSDPGTEPASVEHVSENCVLCFGPTCEVAGLAEKCGNNKTCGHAVHPQCAREFAVAGYSICPACRLPMTGHGQA